MGLFRACFSLFFSCLYVCLSVFVCERPRCVFVFINNIRTIQESEGKEERKRRKERIKARLSAALFLLLISSFFHPFAFIFTFIYITRGILCDFYISPAPNFSPASSFLSLSLSPSLPLFSSRGEKLFCFRTIPALIKFSSLQ